ncbi:probable prolyl 4-hydroxylase 7 [Gossypium hirsutum]|uniref:Probable prolyl 4-hydroxylase 7 n=1 Tax=Gossypium hirsutum TaxID=3635 RepID=A0ABM3AMR8_GOSHI|nr:probable prolyl 4-hydroxylase 7 [Gossypium hirsutum]
MSEEKKLGRETKESKKEMEDECAEINGSVLEMKRGTSSVPFDPTLYVFIFIFGAFLYKVFLSSEECDHLITLAKDKLEKSMVADNESGDSIESEVRTSFGMFLQKAQISRVRLLITDLLLISSPAVLLLTGECVTALIILQFAPFSSLEFRLFIFVDRVRKALYMLILEDEVVADIEARIAVWTFLPAKSTLNGVFSSYFNMAHQPENGESMQILHYENGQKYEPHFDYFHDKANQELGGHRIATVLMYLSDVESGGETVFPNAEGKLSQPKDDSWSDCAKNGYAGHPDSVLRIAASKSREFEAVYGKHRSKGSEDKLPMQSSLDEMVVFIRELISLTRLKTWEGALVLGH